MRNMGTNFKMHPDMDYVDKIFDGRSGSYGWDSIDGPLVIDYIWKRSRFFVFRHNCILYCKYLKRRIIKWRKNIKKKI